MSKLKRKHRLSHQVLTSHPSLNEDSQMKDLLTTMTEEGLTLKLGMGTNDCWLLDSNGETKWHSLMTKHQLPHPWETKEPWSCK